MGLFDFLKPKRKIEDEFPMIASRIASVFEEAIYSANIGVKGLTQKNCMMVVDSQGAASIRYMPDDPVEADRIMKNTICGTYIWSVPAYTEFLDHYRPYFKRGQEGIKEFRFGFGRVLVDQVALQLFKKMVEEARA